jgi:hypothetical protein
VDEDGKPGVAAKNGAGVGASVPFAYCTMTKRKTWI